MTQQGQQNTLARVRGLESLATGEDLRANSPEVLGRAKRRG